MCDVCNKRYADTDIIIENHKVKARICKDCLQYCEICESLYVEGGFCKCATPEQVMEELSERIDNMATDNIDNEDLLGALLVNVVTEEKVSGTDTIAFVIDDHLVLLSSEEVKRILNWQSKYGVREIAELDGSSIYTVPYLEEAAWPFAANMARFGPAFVTKNTYYTDTYRQMLIAAKEDFIEKGRSEEYIQFVQDMIEICNSISAEFVMVDLRDINVREFEDRPVPYDVIYTFEGTYPVCQKCKQEIEYDAIEFENNLWCNNCVIICEECGTVTKDDYYISTNDELLCIACYNEEYTNCYNCDDTISKDGAIEYNGEMYCETCHAIELELEVSEDE